MTFFSKYQSKSKSIAKSNNQLRFKLMKSRNFKAKLQEEVLLNCSTTRTWTPVEDI